jgi:hypothetical protein
VWAGLGPALAQSQAMGRFLLTWRDASYCPKAHSILIFYTVHNNVPEESLKREHARMRIFPTQAAQIAETQISFYSRMATSATIPLQHILFLKRARNWQACMASL